MCSSAWICAARLSQADPLKKSKNSRSVQAFDKALSEGPEDQVFLRLYLAGATDRSRVALKRVLQQCGAEPKGRCKLEVIDVFQKPEMARKNQIVATPTLIRHLPLPVRRLIGDLSDISSLYAGFRPQATRKAAT
jgi:circadian clock protein KaiB